MPTPPLRTSIGIDLGTTNCALAAAGPGGSGIENGTVEAFTIEQSVNPGEVRAEPLLPSCLFLPGAVDFPEGSTALPWDAAPEYVVGWLARKRGLEAPGRVVLSAKSWLSHAGVDRQSAFLPLAAAEGTLQVSPAEASRRYLAHLRQAWNHARPGTPFEDQTVLVTVPASFDAAARALTAEAARGAGYPETVLLEEPQAAFYAWLERHPDWRERVRPGDLVLVVDVGGGTTDFTLIAVAEQAGGELGLERVAVGDHILLGGDNMDLALAHFVQQRLGRKLDAGQFHALWQSCRNAKEAMLAGEGAPAGQSIAILGRGSALIGGTIRAKLARAEAEAVVVDGFFPQVAASAEPARPAASSALAEIGLPYAADPAVTRHLARFLRQAAPRMTKSGLAAPTHVLFNGGVFGAHALRTRLLAAINGWLAEGGQTPAAELGGGDLMQAVARGAAYYGMVRQGRGIRIRGGIGKTYYIGVETAMPAVPGIPPPLKALTVAQFGMEEGARVTLPAKPFALRVGQEADFRFFGSARRREDAPGLLLDEIPDGEIEELAPVRVSLPGEPGGAAGQTVQVTLETEISETGQLLLWCVARDGRRWKLEFNVRDRAARAS